MSKWILKAIFQKLISFFPNPERTNHLFQRYITKGVLLSDYHFGAKMQHAADHYHFFKKYGNPDPKALILELGTGWYPIVPIFFYLTKSGKTTSIDIQSWMNKKSQLICIRKILEWYKLGKLEKYNLPLDIVRLEKLKNIAAREDQYTFEQINEEIQLRIVLTDARHTQYKDQQFDFICSNNTFEHIHIDMLPGILIEFKRILKSGGLMSHFIDMTDHYCHFDHSISAYNFLNFSEKQWKLIDNNIQPQNRWRFYQYLALFKQLNIPITETQVERGDIEALKKVKIHSSFKGKSDKALAITHAYIISVL